MAKVIYFSVDMLGHINPTLGLIKSLVSKGEEILYFSNEKFRDKIVGTGAIFKSYEDTVNFTPREGDSLETLVVFAYYILDKTKAVKEQFLSEIKAFGPQYIIHDAFCYWGKEIAASLDIPGISLTANFPFISEMNRIDSEFFIKYVLRAEDNPLFKKYGRQADVSRKLLNKLSKTIESKYKVENTDVINDIFASKEGLNIIFSSRDFQIYAEAFDESYYFAGYNIYPEFELQSFSLQVPDNKIRGKRPLIYLAFGSLLDKLEDLYMSCFKALGSLDVQVVLSLGNFQGKLVEEEIPANFIIKKWVPQISLLKQADLFITHGGANSIYEAICCSVPQLVIPQAFDEFMGGVMVEHSGTGLNLQDTSPSPERIKTAVLKILNDDNYQITCQKIQNSFLDSGGTEVLVKKIFDYIHVKNKAIK